MCKPFFIGSGENNCISCLEFCHGNSKICIDANLTSNKSQSLHLDLNNITIVSQLNNLYNICIINHWNRMKVASNSMNPFVFTVKTIRLEDFVMSVFQDIFIKRLQNHFSASSKL